MKGYTERQTKAVKCNLVLQFGIRHGGIQGKKYLKAGTL